MPPSPPQAPRYLFLQAGTYYFRRRIPAELQPLFGRREIRLSLGTGYLRTARAACVAVLAVLERALNVGRFGAMEISRAQFIKLLDEQLKEAAVESRTGSKVTSNFFQKAMLLNRDDADFFLDLCDRYIDGKLTQGEDYDRLMSVARMHLDGIGFATGYYLSGVGDISTMEVVKRIKKAAQVSIARSANDFDLEKGLLPIRFSFEGKPGKGNRDRRGNASDRGSPTPAITLKAGLEAFVESRIKTGRWDKDVKSTILHNLVYLTEVLGPGKALSAIRKDDLKKVRDILYCIPKFAKRKKECLARLEDYQKSPAKEGDRLSQKTIENIFTAFNAFFNWSVSEDFIKTNPCDGVLHSAKGRARKKSKIPFEIVDLEKIFDLESYRWYASSPAAFWIPLLAYYTGARREELAQLYVEDVKMVEGLWCLDFNANPAPGGDADKRLKNEESVRIIPIPQAVVDIGFIDYVASLKSAGIGRVFEDLKKPKPHSKYGNELGKRFERYLASIGIKRPMLSFHSFRHTFKHLCRTQDIGYAYRNRYQGHTIESGVSGQYGRDFTPAEFAAVFSKLVFPVDLTPLKALGFGEAQGPDFRPAAPAQGGTPSKPMRQYRRRKTPMTAEEMEAKAREKAKRAKP